MSSSINASTAIAPLKVNVSVVASVATTTESVVVYGTLVPVRESRLSFERGGTIERLQKVAGDRVAEGEVIASLERTELVEQQRQLIEALEQSQQALGSADRESAPAIQQQIGQLGGELQGVEEELKRRIIVAPFTGLISEIKIQQGEIAAPAMPVVILVTDEPPQVETNVTEAMASRVLAAETIWAGRGNRGIELNVKSSSEIRGPTASMKITFGFQEPLTSDSWIYGDVVELRFREAVETSGCWLELSALQRGADERWSVFAVVPTTGASGTPFFKVERRAIDVRLLQNNRVYVEGSLNSGEFVIAEGTHRIVDGQHVVPVATDTLSMEPGQQGDAI